MSAPAERYRYGEHLLESSCARQSAVSLMAKPSTTLCRGGAAGLMSQQILKSIGFKGTQLALLTGSTAVRGIASRSLKYLDIQDLWPQDMVKSNRPRVEKEPAATKWSDLGTNKSLTGMRIGEPLQIMPLTRRGVIVARLLCQVCLTKAQTPNDEEDRTPFCWYFLFVHVMALCGIINLMQRAYHAITAKRVTKRERSSQTEVSTDSGSSQTEGRLVKPSLCVDLQLHELELHDLAPLGSSARGKKVIQSAFAGPSAHFHFSFP